MHLRLFIFTLVGTLLWGSAGFAQGTSVPELMGYAQAAEADLEYDRAVELWNTVIAHPDVSPKQRLQASVRAGSLERIRGRNLEARIHFQYVLKKHPAYQLPANTEPKIKDFFELVRKEVNAKAKAGKAAMEKEKAELDQEKAALDKEKQALAADKEGLAKKEEELANQPPPKTLVITQKEEAPPPSETPAPVVVERTVEKGGMGGLMIIGGTVASLGVAALGLSGISGYMANVEHDAAEATDIQTEAGPHYEQRDLFAGLANGGYAAGGVLVAVGAGLLIADLVMGGGE